MRSRIPKEIRQKVQERAVWRCEYCHLPERLAYSQYHVDHIRPIIHGGSPDDDANFAWACMDCNTHKGPNLSSIDFETQIHTFLYNPRTQHWDDHFQYDSLGYIKGLTPEGRVTIRILDINHIDRLAYRHIMFELGDWDDLA